MAMSISRTHRLPVQGGNYHRDFRSSSFNRHSNNNSNINNSNSYDFRRKFNDRRYNINSVDVDMEPSSKRRKSSACVWEDDRGIVHYRQQSRIGNAPSTSSSLYSMPTMAEENACTFPSYKHEQPKLEDDVVFMSRDEIERCSPSRKDGIDVLRETHLRYTYCTFLQNLGMRLELPQTTIATAMVLCHRFFVRRSHACHDRFLIATATLFLAAKSEETPRPLNTVLKTSYEICHKHNLACFPYYLPVDWFEQYRERVIEAEQMILTTLDFELNVQHPYTPLTSALNKLGLSQTVLVHLAWNLVNEGLRSSLWLQFKPHHIAAGAAFLAAKLLNLDHTSIQSMWQEFKTTPAIVQDVVQQLMELL
ncbi:cyclin-T1-3 isoform X1 [Cinnamomum micranthum f. kanehirae]|uniref:Cyclin-T1-3 isoform X1 n=1 Tax=Cinnamomum micranthum f. kanehirae TaxID=337451 RepID=A0A443NDX1_9MAGN|nr:cyclin-T1-3 isoform X1 [Cinnamomum micranthum f. kanehirae]